MPLKRKPSRRTVSTRLASCTLPGFKALARSLFNTLLYLAPLFSGAITEGPYTFTTNSTGQATITDFNASYSGALSITNTLGGCTVTAIGDGAFANCTGLTAVVIPESVIAIGEEAFRDCSKLTDLTLNNDLSSFYASVFFGGSPLRKVVIGDTVTHIGSWAFEACDLTNLVIGASVSSIGDWAFEACNLLTSVTLPDNVTSIGLAAFSSCLGLTNLTVGAANPTYASLEGVLFNRSFTTLIQCPGGKTGAYAMPSSVTFIGDLAFYDCASLTSVTISDSAAGIGNGAFYGCGKLTSATIPGSVTNIGDNAFTYCGSMTSVSIPASVTTIGRGAFDGCYSLPSVILPDSVTFIGVGAFFACDRLTAVLFEGNAPALGGSYVFNSTPATIYYLPGTSGWSAEFGGRPALCWNPAVQAVDAFGFSSGPFTFSVSGHANIPVKIEAATNLAATAWAPITNATLGTAGSLTVTDPDSADHPSRFYRIVFP